VYRDLSLTPERTDDSRGVEQMLVLASRAAARRTKVREDDIEALLKGGPTSASQGREALERDAAPRASEGTWTGSGTLAKVDDWAAPVKIETHLVAAAHTTSCRALWRTDAAHAACGDARRPIEAPRFRRAASDSGRHEAGANTRPLARKTRRVFFRRPTRFPAQKPRASLLGRERGAPARDEQSYANDLRAVARLAQPYST